MDDPVLQTVTRHWPDIEYFVRAEVHDYYLSFRAYRRSEMTDCATGITTVQFDRAGHPNGEDPFVDDIGDAQVFVSGSVKWDGCSNINFDDQDVAMLHHCDRKGLAGIGELLGRLWDLAAETVPHWDKDLKGG